MLTEFNKDILRSNGWDIVIEAVQTHITNHFLAQLPFITFSPTLHNIFRPFLETNFNYIQVVIIGQSPYPINATGHAFESNIITPTLKVIFDTLKKEYPGNLNHWIKQHILLLNSALTIGTGIYSQIPHFAAWEPFMAIILKELSKRGGIVFMVWGRSASNLLKYIIKKNNLIISTNFPIPNIQSDFQTSNQFQQANDFLMNSITW
jgi:uracil-DNA glycosylase